MSWKASAWVKDLRYTPKTQRQITPAEKSILYTLADYFNEEWGYANPSIDRAAAESGLSSRQAMRLLKALGEEGVLVITKGMRQRNQYRFVGKGDILSLPKGCTVTSEPIKGDIPQGVNVTLTSIETNNLKKPSPRKERAADVRHSGFVTLWQKAWAHAFPDRASGGDSAPFCGRSAAALRDFLAQRGTWTDEDSRLALWNLLKSAKDRILLAPWKWIPDLELYRAAPRDQFGNAINSKARVSEGAPREEFDQIVQAKEAARQSRADKLIAAAEKKHSHPVTTGLNTREEWLAICDRYAAIRPKGGSDLPSMVTRTCIPAFIVGTSFFVLVESEHVRYFLEGIEDLLTALMEWKPGLRKIEVIEGDWW